MTGSQTGIKDNISLLSPSVPNMLSCGDQQCSGLQERVIRVTFPISPEEDAQPPLLDPITKNQVSLTYQYLAQTLSQSDTKDTRQDKISNFKLNLVVKHNNLELKIFQEVWYHNNQEE